MVKGNGKKDIGAEGIFKSGTFTRYQFLVTHWRSFWVNNAELNVTCDIFQEVAVSCDQEARVVKQTIAKPPIRFVRNSLLDCNTVSTCRWIPTFREKRQPASNVRRGRIFPNILVYVYKRNLFCNRCYLFKIVLCAYSMPVKILCLNNKDHYKYIYNIHYIHQ